MAPFLIGCSQSGPCWIPCFSAGICSTVVVTLIPTLEQTFNISSRFTILHWDCNYLEGIRPCVNPANPCSERTLFKTQVSTSGGFNSSFNFATNCYSDAIKQERDSDPLQCGTSHTLYCEDLHATNQLAENLPKRDEV